MKETLLFSLSVFAVSVEPAVQKADPLVQDVLVLRHHPVSHHPLLPDETLKLYSSEASEPHGPFDQVFWVGFKITQYPNVVINSKHASLLRPSIHLFQFGNGVHSYSSTSACAEVSRAESPRAAQQSSKHRHASENPRWKLESVSNHSWMLLNTLKIRKSSR